MKVWRKAGGEGRWAKMVESVACPDTRRERWSAAPKMAKNDHDLLTPCGT